MLYSYTHTETVGVKGLTIYRCKTLASFHRYTHETLQQQTINKILAHFTEHVEVILKCLVWCIILHRIVFCFNENEHGI